MEPMIKPKNKLFFHENIFLKPMTPFDYHLENIIMYQNDGDGKAGGETNYI